MVHYCSTLLEIMTSTSSFRVILVCLFVFCSFSFWINIKKKRAYNHYIHMCKSSQLSLQRKGWRFVFWSTLRLTLKAPSFFFFSSSSYATRFSLMLAKERRGCIAPLGLLKNKKRVFQIISVFFFPQLHIHKREQSLPFF